MVLDQRTTSRVPEQGSDPDIPATTTAVVAVLAWGEEYVDKLLRLSLPALAAAGNYPCLAQAFDCELVILTEKQFFQTISRSEVWTELGRHGRSRLIAIDDLLVGPGSYGLTLTLAFFRVLQEFGARMVDTWFLFLNADFILADNCYSALVPEMRKGESAVICSPSYCAIEENVLPILDRYRVRGQAAISFPKREMAEVILGNLHNTVRGQQIDGPCHFERSYLYQGYLRPDARILLGYQMPIAIVALRPTHHVEEMTTFWDWGGVSELCPGGRETVLGDSDDFLMLELRTEATAAELLRLGPPTPEHIASRLRRQLTRDQVHFGQFPLTLHSCDLPADIEQVREPLRAFYQRMRTLLDADPVAHSNHPDWLVHYGYYREKQAGEPLHINDDRATSKFLAAVGHNVSNALMGAYGEAFTELGQRETVKLLKRMKREFSQFLQASVFREGQSEAQTLAAFLDEYRALVFRHYNQWLSHEQKKYYLTSMINSPHAELQRQELRLARRQVERGVRTRRERPTLSLDQPRLLQSTGSTKRRALLPRSVLRSLAHRLLGRPPFVSTYHPYWAVFRNVASLLDRYATQSTKVLIVSDFPDSGIQLFLREKCAKVLKISVSEALNSYAHARDGLDLCFCELPRAQLGDVRQIYDGVLGAMAGNSKIVVFVNNETAGTFPPNSPELVVGALSVGAPLKVRYSGSELSAKAVLAYAQSTSAKWRSPLQAGRATLQWARLAHKANQAEARSVRDADSVPPAYCTSVTIEIDVPDFMVSQHRLITTG